MRNLVKHWMTHQLVTVAAGEPARAALEAMEDNVIHHVLVCSEAGALEGIVSDRDTVRIALQNAGRVFDIDGCTVASIMTAGPLETTDPEATLVQAARQMLEGEVNALPVLDQGRLIGILTHQDILGATVEQSLEG